MWDVRAFKKPLATRSDLATLYPNTNAVFSPDDKYIITGAGASAKGGHGKLIFLDKNGLDVVKTLEVDATPVKVFWHSKINQVRLPLFGLDCYSSRGVDCDGALKRADMRAIFAVYVAEWGEVACEQGPPEKADDRGHVGCAGRAVYSHTGRVDDVPGGRWAYQDEQAEAGQRPAGPAEGTAARAAGYWPRAGRAGGGERDATCGAKPGTGHDPRRRRAYALSCDGGCHV